MFMLMCVCKSNVSEKWTEWRGSIVPACVVYMLTLSIHRKSYDCDCYVFWIDEFNMGERKSKNVNDWSFIFIRLGKMNKKTRINNFRIFLLSFTKSEPKIKKIERNEYICRYVYSTVWVSAANSWWIEANKEKFNKSFLYYFYYLLLLTSVWVSINGKNDSFIWAWFTNLRIQELQWKKENLCKKIQTEKEKKSFNSLVFTFSTKKQIFRFTIRI